MKLKCLSLGSMDNNCYLISDETTREAAIIDAPCEADEILGVLEQEKLCCKYILLTHSHFDHVGAVNQVRSATGATLAVHPLDADELMHPVMRMYAPKIEKEPDLLLHDGQTIELGNVRLLVLHTPGHTKGGVCYYTPGKLFSGDTLFFLDVGRCDLPGGNYDTIKRSIREKLYVLPDETEVYPGHGRSTTIGFEKANNHYIRQDWEYEY